MKPDVSKTLSALGLCKKAGKLVLGFDAAADAIKKGNVRLLLLARDISPKSAGKITRPALDKNIKTLTLPVAMDELWHMLGKRAGILAVTDEGLAALIIKTSKAVCQYEEENSL